MPHTRVNRILYVEDDEALARLLQLRLERHHLIVETVLTAEQALEKLKHNTYDILLVDYVLPGMSGLELLDELMNLSDSPPAIILTVGGDERIAIAALEKGAADYAVKDPGNVYFELLPAIMQAAHTKYRLQREYEIQHQELQAEKEKAEAASQAKSNFLAIMSHEMRTPLNVVIGLAHLLTNTELGPREKHMVDTLLTNADLLLKLINDLLDISRIESGQIELETMKFDFASVLDDLKIMFESHAQEQNLNFVVHNAVGEYMVYGDRTRIQQILMNLAGNAFKFTKEGTVKVTATSVPQNSNQVSFIIKVEDTGIGIPQDKLEKIFDKFTQADESITRRFGGSGLGLAIALALAQQMGGDIQVQSQPGKGSIFTLTLTLLSAQELPKRRSQTMEDSQTANDSQRSKVLIVEDYAPNMMVARLMLESFGYEVVEADNGTKALECVRMQQAPFIAILMDVQMQGIDGYEVTAEIRKLEKSRGHHNHIIGVTAHALAGDRERCVSAGMDDYVSKPIHPEILIQKLVALSGPTNTHAAA